MSTSLAARLPALEWSWRSANGEAPHLRWVATRLDPDAEGYRMVRRGDETQYRSRNHLAELPAAVVGAAVAAQQRGRATGWEGMVLLFARLEWLITSRRYLWTPQSPVPALLATLVEAYGVEADLHGGDPERLVRLAALLPVWHPHRGSVGRARQVLDLCERGGDLATAWSDTPARDVAPGSATDATAPQVQLADEVLVLHRLAWWELRAGSASRPQHRITHGFVRFQPTSTASGADGFAMRREDVLIPWSPGSAVPKEAMRLLPAWTVVRLATPSGRN